jgi:murein DD-endopeptidase MepM/ murein hydrolase activator NlpD
MKLLFCVCLALLLAGCAAAPLTPPPAAAFLPTSLPAETDTPTASSTPAPTSSDTPTESPAPSESQPPSATPTMTVPPTATAVGFIYVFPVQPARNTGFSEGGHTYPATDIFADFGAQFVAVTSGVVDYVTTKDLWDPLVNDSNLRGGLSVAIIGDDGVRYYGSHLSAVAAGIAVGVRVKPGQLLGLVGNSGDAAGRSTHLHFGISPPTYPADWHSRRGLVDPYPYLLAWKKGVNVTPVLANLTITPYPTATP